jgi:hypothetical protein
MTRILSTVLLSLLAVSASATDRFAREPEQISIATTGRITKIDARNKTFKVRGSDGQGLSVRNMPQNISGMMQGMKQRVSVTLPGGITIALPGRSGKTGSSPAEETRSLDEFTVIVTKETVLEDGGEPIGFQDFKTGDTISIHGELSGATVTASRVAKWF